MAGKEGQPQSRAPETQLQPAAPGRERIERREVIDRPAGGVEAPGVRPSRKSPERGAKKTAKKAERAAGQEKKAEKRPATSKRSQREKRLERERPEAREKQREEELKEEGRREERERRLAEERRLEQERIANRRPWRERIGDRVPRFGFIRRPVREEGAVRERVNVNVDSTDNRPAYILTGAAAVVAAAVLFSLCSPDWRRAFEGSPTGTPRAGQATPTPRSAAGSPSPEPSPTFTPSPFRTEAPATLGPRRTAAPDQPQGTTGFVEDKRVESVGVTVIGTPEKVAMSTIDIARGQFRNTIGNGSEAYLAEPGGILVGPDFFDRQANNPLGRNSRGADTMYDAGGAIRPFSPVSQEVLRTYGIDGASWQNVPEGGFIKISAGHMTVEINGKRFIFEGKPGRNHFFIVRGVYPDGKQDSDLNRTAKITNYKAGHILVEMIEAAERHGIGFMSEGQFLQTAGTSHSHGTNCGAEGCSELIVTFYDINTGNWATMRQVQGRFTDPRQGWESIASNWDPSK